MLGAADAIDGEGRRDDWAGATDGARLGTLDHGSGSVDATADVSAGSDGAGPLTQPPRTMTMDSPVTNEARRDRLTGLRTGRARGCDAARCAVWPSGDQR